MKTLINFTNSWDDLARYQSAEDLRTFYQRYGCSGIELMPLEDIYTPILTPEMVIGVHLCCIHDWMGLTQEELICHYRKNLDYAHQIQAEYVVFHVTQVSEQENLTYQLEHTDAEVIAAASDLINALLDDQPYTFYFLMENLWWPGLNFLNPSVTQELFARVHYPHKGFLLDTGHLMHTNLHLRTQEEALQYLYTILAQDPQVLSQIKGIHLHQSLSGSYVQQWFSTPHTYSSDPAQRSIQLYEHIFVIDQHLPFTAPGIPDLIARIDPLYVVYEYITRNREEHAQYLEKGSRLFI